MIILGATVLVLGGLMTIILTFFGPSSNLSFGNKIGVIFVEGLITDPEPVVSQLVAFKKDNGIKAIILRINSPGGGQRTSVRRWASRARACVARCGVCRMAAVWAVIALRTSS